MSQIVKNGNALQVSGAVTVETVNALLADSAGAFAGGSLQVDLGAVAEVDSAAISLVFEWMRQAQRSSADLVFVNLPPNLACLATLYGVLDLIPQHTH